MAIAARTTFFHVLWRCLFVFAVFLVCIPHSSAGNEELEYTLRCALLGKFDKKCRLEGPEVKPHLIELMKRAPASFRAVLRGQFSELKPSLVGKIPPSLVYFLPAEVWSRMEPSVASELIKSHKKNEAIARSVMQGYANASLSDKKDFLGLFDFNSLDHSVISIMASEISSIWNIDDDTLTSFGSPPFFVALPEAHVLKMDKNQQAEILDEIVRWDPYGLNKEKWFHLPAITKRVWAIVSRNYSYKGDEKRITAPLLAGATPSELQHEVESFSEYELMQLPLKNRLQIRALFPLVRNEEPLNRIDLSLLKNWFLLLSPDQILRFKHDLEFMHIVKEKNNEYWSHPNIHKIFAFPSVPTVRQIIEITTMIHNEEQTLPLDPTQWGNKISLFGPLAFLIGARRLGKLDTHQNALDLHTLKEIDSYHFSRRMARHLMFNSTAILKVKGLLRGFPTGTLLDLGKSGIDGMDFVREVVQDIPAEIPARSALVFRKLRENLEVFNTLEAILRNPNPEQFMSLLTLKETGKLYKAFSHDWTRVESEDLADKIRLLPDSVLSNLLSTPKELGMESNRNNHLESKSLAGLTCEHLLAADTTNIPDLIAAMRHIRKRAGKAEMSKKLQRCARIALDKFLIERASSTFASKKAVMSSTPIAINPVDIDNFGGFVLATFTPEEIERNPYAKLIMKKIGSLSAHELISAIPCYKCLRKMAEVAVRINNGERNITFSHLLDLGSFVGFLPTSMIGAIHPAHWRITAEAASLDGSSPPLCADEESRVAWERLIRSAFGPPEHWTADTLASIGGYMPTLLENTLESVSLNERAFAGDTMGMTSGAPYLYGVEIIGYDHPRAFWKVCRDLLDRDDRKDYEMALRIAARFQLNGAQLFASTVKNADTLKELRTKKHQATFKSIRITSVAPPDSDKLVDVPSSTTTTTSIPVWSTWFNKNSEPVKKEENAEPPTLKKQPSEEKKLETSDDLNSYIDNFYDETEVKPVRPVSTVPPNAETTYSAVTEPISEAGYTDSVTSANLGVTDASLAFLQEEQKAQIIYSAVNSSSQVYVEEDERVDKSNDTTDPPIELKMNLHDVPRPPTTSSTLKPLKETNGTVYEFPRISVIPEPPESELELTDKLTTPSTDDSIVVTLSQILLGNSSAESTANLTTSDSPVVPKSEPPRGSLPSTTPIPTPHPFGSAPNLTTSFSRRRRYVNVQAFETPLTCDGLLTMGPAVALALSLSDVDMVYEEFEDCVEFIGKLELPKEVAKAFWKKLKMASHWDTIADVGCLAAGMSKDDVEYLNLDINGEHFLDTISVLSLYADNDVVKSMISKLKGQLEAEISKGKVALAEEIALALGLDICHLPEESRSYLVNTPNVLPRSLSGINREEFFERSVCQPECLRGLVSALVNQNKTREWTSADSRNAGVLMAGLSEEELKRLSSTKTSQTFAEISAGAVRCLSESQLKVLQAESFTWWSPIAAGALSEDQLRILSEEQKSALQSAVFGRTAVNYTEEAVLASGSTDFAPNLALTAILASLVVKCYVILS